MSSSPLLTKFSYIGYFSDHSISMSATELINGTVVDVEHVNGTAVDAKFVNGTLNEIS